LTIETKAKDIYAQISDNMSFYNGPLPVQGDGKKSGVLLDSDTKRLLELTSTSDRSQDAVEEIISIVQRKVRNCFPSILQSC